MIALTFSFQELLGYLKKNLRKVPPIVKTLKCINNTFFLTIPRKDAPPVPIDGNVTFSGQNVNVILTAAGIRSLARINLTTRELFSLSKLNIRKLPGFVETTQYKTREGLFHIRFEMEKQAEDIELLAKLIRRLDRGIRLRIAPVWK